MTTGNTYSFITKHSPVVNIEIMTVISLLFLPFVFLSIIPWRTMGFQANKHHIFSSAPYGDGKHDCDNQHYLYRKRNSQCHMCLREYVLPTGQKVRNGTCLTGRPCQYYLDCCKPIVTSLRVRHTETYLPFITSCSCQRCTQESGPYLQDILKNSCIENILSKEWDDHKQTMQQFVLTTE